MTSTAHPDIIAQVIRRITETTPVPLQWKVGALASLKDDLGLDNIDRLTIACAIDEDLAIAIPDAALTAWETVEDVVTTAAQLCFAKPTEIVIKADRPVAQPNWNRIGFAGIEDAEGRN